MIELDFSRFNNILVVAPHADDEVLGCGGILLNHKNKVDVLLLSDGRHGISRLTIQTGEEVASIRKKEFDSVMAATGIRHAYNMDIPDREVKSNKTRIYKFNIKKYDAIFVPNKYDAHRDHQATYQIFKDMKRIQRSNALLFEYEVWTPIREPLYYVDVSDCYDNICSLLLKYESQIAERDYLGLFYGLSIYRGVQCKTSRAMVYTTELPGGKLRRFGSYLPNPVKERVKSLFHL